MIMADVAALFGTLLALGIAFPGLMLTTSLVFPGLTARAETRLARTPWKSFFLGGVGMFGALVPVLILFNLPGSGGQFLGFVALLVLLAVTCVGASGMARALGRRLDSAESLSPAARVVRGAVALELAAVFPLVGWFLVIPLTLVASLGATMFAVLHWMPKSRNDAPPASVAVPANPVPAP